MKQTAKLTAAVALTCLGMAGIATGATVNDRSFVAQISPSLTTSGAAVPYRLSVTNDLKSGPSHFIEQVVVTVPKEFTLVNLTGTSSPVTLPPLWTVASITGSTGAAHVITFTTTSLSMTSGKSATFIINASTAAPLSTDPCKLLTWTMTANQAINGGVGNTYNLRAGTSYPSVTLGPPTCGAQTVLSLVGAPSGIGTLDATASVTLTATLTSRLTGAPIPNEPITFRLGGEPVSCLSGTALTNSLGAATCMYYPQASPNTPLIAGNYDAFAHFGGDAMPTPPWGSSDSAPWQLAVSATGTGISVLPASGPFNGTVDLQATLTSGNPSVGVAGKTITFQLNAVAIPNGTAVTDASGVATLSGVSLVGIAAGVHTGYIGVSFAGDGTYSAVSNSADLNVTAISGNISLSNMSQVYSRAALSPTVTTVAASYSLTGAPQTDVGDYNVTATITDPNYTGSASGPFAITPKSVTAIVTASNKVYDGGTGAGFTGCSLTGVVPGDAVTCTVGSAAFDSANVGSRTVTAGGITLGGASAGNYVLSSTMATTPASITARPATVTADAKSKTYGAANPTLTATVTGTVGTETLNYSLATTALQFSNVGPYPIAVTLGSNPNYSVTPTNGTLTVTPATATVTADAKSKIYGADNPAMTATVTGTVNGDALNYTLATTAVKFSGVGPYPITVTLGSNPNYSVTPTNGTLTVTQATATVTADNQTKTYGADNPALTATVGGTLNGDTLNYTLATTAVKFSGVGPYPITVTLGTNPNYSVTPANGTLTVNQATATVTADAKSKTYGADNPALTATVTGTLNGDTLNYTLATTAVKFSGVGGYPIAVTLGSNPNYIVTPTDGTLTVNQATASVTADNKSRIFGAANPTLTATVVGAVNGDTLNFSLATTATTASNVGGYAITVTLGSNPNYSVTPTNGTLTVTQAPVTVTLSNMSQVYTGSPLSPTVSSPVAYTLSGAPATDVGDYDVAVTLNDANYTGGATGTFHITKAAQTITFTTMIVTATATSGAPVAFSTSTPAFCAVVPALDGNNNPLPGQAKVTLLQGNWNQCTVLANQDGANTNFGAAPQATGVLTTTP
jgi:hypothetical protein